MHVPVNVKGIKLSLIWNFLKSNLNKYLDLYRKILKLFLYLLISPGNNTDSDKILETHRTTMLIRPPRRKIYSEKLHTGPIEKTVSWCIQNTYIRLY